MAKGYVPAEYCYLPIRVARKQMTNNSYVN